jgi:hypothetical protein
MIYDKVLLLVDTFSYKTLSLKNNLEKYKNIVIDLLKEYKKLIETFFGKKA